MAGPEVEPIRVSELTGDEGGVWRVRTRDSTHYVDLERGTVTRVPGVNAPPTVNDRARPLRTIDTLRVGARGRWTMYTDGPDENIDFFWANTSLVAAIEAISRDQLPGADGVVPH
ncbi:hypothetical protein [Cryobacterium psychrophilum]|uniref:Uncharacterized protein n=1 Tax=Cryobacterium psychrophilum TaxID=41988 RepID=A0A4Y8KSD7_9MICO|nr:hypothetical protein [Cryobacterium psychrophilum]TDW30349.1 hypothetical protein EDD25_2100 [Cryobacterium psychrophilum]TFD79044.1 hypothetical protein E3T53_08050 [Cryobacterium psychrophilum]